MIRFNASALFLSAAVFLSSCAGTSVKKDDAPSDTPISAATRQQAFTAIEKQFVDKGTRTRIYPGGKNDGWLEEIKFLKLEEVKTEPVKDGKHRMIVRETRQVTRWKTYYGKTKGEPVVRQDTSTQSYIF